MQMLGSGGQELSIYTIFVLETSHEKDQGAYSNRTYRNPVACFL